jgi:hypothetical protein
MKHEHLYAETIFNQGRSINTLLNFGKKTRRKQLNLETREIINYYTNLCLKIESSTRCWCTCKSKANHWKYWKATASTQYLLMQTFLVPSHNLPPSFFISGPSSSNYYNTLVTVFSRISTEKKLIFKLIQWKK